MKKFAVIVFALIFLFSLFGTSRDIDSLGMVAGMAFDKGEKDINVSVCMVKANGLFGTEGKNGDPYFVSSCSSDTFAKAKRSLSLETERMPFFGHNDMIFIECGAQLEKILEQLYKDSDTRGAESVVLCENKASCVFDAKNFMGDISTLSIFDILMAADKSGEILPLNIHELVKALKMPSSCCLVPVGRTDNGAFEFAGMGIVKDFEYCGMLSETEKTGAFCLLEKTASFVAEVDGSAYESEIVYSDVKFSGGVFAVKTVISVKNAEDSGLYEKYIRGCIEAALKKVHTSGCDFLGLSNAYYRSTGKKEMITDFNYMIDVEVSGT